MGPFSRFQPDSWGFSGSKALAMGLVADWMQQPRELAQPLVAGVGFPRHRWVAAAGRGDGRDALQALVAGNGRMLLVAFHCGPEREAAFIGGDDFPKTGFHAGRVHRTMERATDALWPEVRGALHRLRDREQAVWLTGYSLGGALALLLAGRLLAEGEMPVAGVYTFGAPRVGDVAFTSWMDGRLKARVFRYVNNHDLVTRVPPRRMDFRHVGTLRFFDSDGTLYQDRKKWQSFVLGDRNPLEKAHDPQDRHALLDSPEHQMAHYLAWLQENRDQPPR